VDTKDMKMEQIWGKDPTTPTEEVMMKIAAGIHAVEVRLKQKRQLLLTRTSGQAQPGWSSMSWYRGRGGRMGRRGH
jgi:hypothetical protein